MSPNERACDNSPSSSLPSNSLEKGPQQIPRIDLDLREHKKVLFIQALITTTASGILPLAGYLILHYLTSLKTQIILSIFTPIFGVVSLFSLIVRTIRLWKSSSTCRPLGATNRWVLDYFDWNFAGGFVALSIVISIGISQTPSNVRIVALPLSILLVQVCGQMVVLTPMRWLGMKTLFRISSLAKGELVRPACYTIAEDVVAVDGRQGDAFRAVWNARYEASPPFRRLLAQMDILWGTTGVAVAAGCIATIFAVDNTTIGWAVGKSFDPPKKICGHMLI